MINGPEVGGGVGISLSSAPPGCEGIRGESKVTVVGAPGTAAAEEEEKSVTWTGVALPLWPWVPRRGGSPAPAKFEASGATLRGARVPPRAVPSAGSVPPLLPGQDKGSLTRDGTALHKCDWSEREPETERERRERPGARELGEATGAPAGGDGRPHAGPGGASGRTQ